MPYTSASGGDSGRLGPGPVATQRFSHDPYASAQEFPAETLPLFDLRYNMLKMHADDVFAVASGAPRWLSFAGSECPSMSDLLGLDDRSGDGLPMHLKAEAIGRIGVNERQALLSLPVVDNIRYTNCVAAFRWLHDVSLFEELRARGTFYRKHGHSSFSSYELQQMGDVGKLCADIEPSLWGFESCMFGHAEWSAHHHRVILQRPGSTR